MALCHERDSIPCITPSYVVGYSSIRLTSLWGEIRNPYPRLFSDSLRSTRFLCIRRLMVYVHPWWTVYVPLRTSCLELYYSDFHRVLLSSHLPLHIGIPLRKTAWWATITLFSSELYKYYTFGFPRITYNWHLSNLGSSLVSSKRMPSIPKSSGMRKPSFFHVHI